LIPACRDEAGPTAPFPSPSPTPTQPAPDPYIAREGVDLNGVWSGTFSQRGSSEQIQATLYHLGDRVTGDFSTSEGWWMLEGTLYGRGLQLKLWINEQVWANLSGWASSTRISVAGQGVSIELTR
ncbi:MAG: hypothetical protein ACRD1P_08700, partial [Thermoanaerobaculia bacterium]